MANDRIVRVNICFPVSDPHTLNVIDQARGNLSRSQAIYRLLGYLADTGVNWIAETIKNPYIPKECPRPES